MNIKNLFNEDDPRCLYCNGICKANYSGGLEHQSFLEDEYHCLNCGETFLIIGDAINKNLFNTTLIFTCIDLKVMYFSDAQQMAVSKLPNLNLAKDKFISFIPNFDIDFSQKDLLYQKLKTYLIFS